MALFLLLLLPLCVESLFDHKVRETFYFNDLDAGEKLVLTPYIKAGHIAEARNLSRVTPFQGNVSSYSGYLSVDVESCESNMFFWFFPAARNFKTAPVIVWLQGGPGASSLFGLFEEHGPYEFREVNGKEVLGLRKYSWHQVGSVLYIDNPVGTGFSSTGKPWCYSQNETHVGQNLLSVVKQIRQLFPEIRSNPFYVTGESYGGKYVTALGYAIHKENRVSADEILLEGLAIGNGFVDPGNQLHYSDYLYQLGLLDTRGRTFFASVENQCRSYIYSEKWAQAFHCFDVLLNGDDITGNTYFYNITGFKNYFNYLYEEEPPEEYMENLVRSAAFRKAVHVGNSPWNNISVVLNNLKSDVMKSVRPWLEELLEHYRVLIYNGQLDIVVAYPLTESYLKKLEWSAAKAYANAERHQWRVDKKLAGYVKVAGHLTEVMVRNAGHMAPADQPKWAFDLISRFIYRKPYF